MNKITKREALCLLAIMCYWHRTCACKTDTCDVCAYNRAESERMLAMCEHSAILAPEGTKIRGRRRGCVVTYTLSGYEQGEADVFRALARIEADPLFVGEKATSDHTSDNPFSFDTVEQATTRARTWEDKVDAVAEYGATF